ncbi:MAG: carboxymuconolactone decarboxylase [Gammaproteobacteria bacterium]|nr:MAG: carboxymuconolactone decarboxylase [Gammaproteobacteria bacterium]
MSDSKNSVKGGVQPLPMVEAKKRGEEVGLPGHFSQLNVFRVLLHHPPLAKVLADNLSMLLGQGNVLKPRLRELIIMRIGWQTGSNYEWTQHWRIAIMCGATEEELFALRTDWKSSGFFDDADRAVLAATDDMLEHGRILPQTLGLVKAHVGGEDQVIEVVAAICNWRTFSQLLLSLEVELEEGIESWAPDGKVPDNAPQIGAESPTPALEEA